MMDADPSKSEDGSNRRNFLREIGALGAVGLAGCAGEESENGDDPENGDNPENGDPENGDPENGDPENGDPENGDDRETEPPEDFEEFQAVVAEFVSSMQPVVDQGPYDATESSLSEVDPVPEWFRDAKFGIYFHWGPYSVAAYQNEWYPRHMYDENQPSYDYHVETYGQQDEYPYQDLVPEFGAESFDPEAWLDLFEEAGARFTGPIAEHHDGWSNWDSAINPWNAGDMGPERDVTGELASATRDRDLKFVATFHHARRGLPWEESQFEAVDPAGEVGHYSHAYDDFPSVTEGWPDRVMYANMPTDLFLDEFLAKVVEVVDVYEPDLLWFDNAVETVPDDDVYQLLAYYYNWAAENDREVAVTRKQEDIPLSMSVEDFEQGRPASMQDQAWLTDTTLSTSSWSYVEGQSYKSVTNVVHTLIDIVSKNGAMLLNVSPRADGTIPQEQQDRILAVGDWLETHGEAVYETRPWEVFGEGPTRLEEGGHFIGSVDYTGDDVRYTQSKDGETLYAHVLGWPGAGTLTLDAVEVTDADGGTATLLDHGEVDVSVDGEDRPELTVPDLSASERPSDHAVVFALQGFDLSSQGGHV